SRRALTRSGLCTACCPAVAAYLRYPALSALSEQFVNPDQLVFRPEIDLDPAARALADDADACAEGEPQAFFGGARVHVHWLWRCRLGGRVRVASLLHHRFGLADREASGDDVAREPALLGAGGEGQQGACVAHRERARGDLGADFV